MTGNTDRKNRAWTGIGETVLAMEKVIQFDYF